MGKSAIRDSSRRFTARAWWLLLAQQRPQQQQVQHMEVVVRRWRGGGGFLLGKLTDDLRVRLEWLVGWLVDVGALEVVLVG